MFSVSTDWNPKQARLKSIVRKHDTFEEAIDICLELHANVHSSEVSGTKSTTFADEIFDGVSDQCFHRIALTKGRTFAYHIWHITRIEDICANIYYFLETHSISKNPLLLRI